MMHILHISTAKTWRGGEQQIAYTLSGTEQLGIKNYLYCPRHSALHQYSLQHGFSVYTFTRFNFNPIAALDIVRLVKTLHIDLIHIHDSHAHNLIIMGYWFFGLKTSSVLHRRVDFPIQSNFFSYLKYNHRRIKKIICVSEFVQNMVARRIRNTQKLCTVYSGIDTTSKQMGSTKSLHQLFHIPEHFTIIANIAAVAPHKDYFTWVNTVELLKENSALHFIIFGEEGKDWPVIHNYIKSKSLEHHITFAGFIKDLDQYFQDINILLVSSKEEGLNTSILDAFIRKIPVVTTNAGGIPELVIHKKTGWLGKVGDPDSLSHGVNYVLQHPAEIKLWTENAKKLAETKSYQYMCKNIAAIYNSVLLAK